MSRKQELTMGMPHPAPTRPTRHTQRGLSLLVVMLALLTLAFASVALVRSIDTGSLVLGNLAFKKAATSSSDQAVNTAITWLGNNLGGTTLQANDTANGYYATSLSDLDISGNDNVATKAHIDWKGDSCGSCVSSGTCSACLAPRTLSQPTPDGFTQSYVIARMCKTAGDPNATTNSCVTPTSSSAGSAAKRGELKYGDNVRFTDSGGAYFRIIVRTSGPQNTAATTETYVHF